MARTGKAQKPRRLTAEMPARNGPQMIGYARVSMSDQTNRRQIDALVQFGVPEHNIYLDEASGRTMRRPGWQAAWKDLRPGDLLVVHAIDRLGRDIVEVVQTIRDLHEMGANLKVLSFMDIDTRTPQGKLIFTILAAMAQWERELIVERTKQGLEAARARGRFSGAPPKMDEAKAREGAARIRAGERPRDVAASYNVKRPTLYKWIKKLGEHTQCQ